MQSSAPDEDPTRDGGSPVGGLRRWVSHWTVRARVLASVLLMSALGLAAAGGVANLIQTRYISDSVNTALVQEVQEFRALATEGIDPDTGQRFTTVEQLLLIALQRNVPSPNEMFLTYLGGRPDKYSPGGLPELVEDPAVVRAVTDVPATADTVVNREVQTSVGTVRLAIVPVGIENQSQRGTYVVAFAVDRELEQQTRLMRTYALVSAVAIVVIGAVGWLVAGRLLRPLSLLRDATQRIGETDLGARVPVTGNDDVSDLGETFNAMLSRLETAFETQRQFLDDAGHELRTPLTIVRGHLELLDSSDEQEVSETRALLLDEVDRMSRLVEDLMLLAKAERADFIHPGLVDLRQLTDDVFDKATALGDRDWQVEGRADASIVGDEQRLTQAVLELALNAVKYTEPGTTVAIGTGVAGSPQPDEALIWVRDEGPGIDQADVERIFERFGRAASGTRVEGSGLGLSIVKAIAEAHHGRVEVHRGAPGVTFTIILPLTNPTFTEAASPMQMEKMS